jgi:hypothetical protein
VLIVAPERLPAARPELGSPTDRLPGQDHRMDVLTKALVFLGPAILAAITRTTLVVVHGGVALAEADRDPAGLFDSSIDLLLASTAILLGLPLYVKTGSTLTKPGTAIPIPPDDIVFCCFVLIVALIMILFSSLALPHFAPAHTDLCTVWFPDSAASWCCCGR